MQTTIICPNCHTSFPLEDALKNQIGEEALSLERKKHQSELDEVRLKTQKETEEKTKAESELELKNLRASAAEEKERSNKFLNELTELNKKLRTLERKDEERDLQMQKTLAEKEEIIRYESKKKSDEENSNLNRAKDKTIEDLLKQLDEAKRKAQQGSQQTQGEILELELERLLKNSFKFDVISEIKKGAKGADVQQIVCSSTGTQCGVILWESKNYQEKWSNTWIPKLKQDVRAIGASAGILVTHTLPKEITTDFTRIDGVWVCKAELVIPVASAIRERIYEVARQKSLGENQGKTADQLYEYITGSNEFRQQLEATIEVYLEMKEQIDSERRSFEMQWGRREKQLQKYITNLASIFGNIQGITGQSNMPTIKGLSLLELENGKEPKSAELTEGLRETTSTDPI